MKSLEQIWKEIHYDEQLERIEEFKQKLKLGKINTKDIEKEYDKIKDKE
ncbi:MAG: hypothetical protein GY941_22760 [Planctomycetes bacterium]|nr:hypothetical protein [Planctomycetota bacterium]